MIKSPLRYPGGKSKAINFLKNFIPDFDEFREPFSGGASFSFYIAQNYARKKIIISDLNYELFCFWKTLKDNSELLIGEVMKIFMSKNEGRKLFNEILAKRNTNLTQIQRAIDFFILNRITFSGVVDSGGYSEASFQKRFTKSSIERLEPAANVLRNISVHNHDYKKILSKPGKNVFIFLDPPYYSCKSSRLYGKKGILHQQFDHEVFFSCVKNTSHKWLITYDNSEFIRDLYKDFPKIEWELQYGMNNYKKNNAAKGKELLIANFDITNQPLKICR